MKIKTFKQLSKKQKVTAENEFYMMYGKLVDVEASTYEVVCGLISCVPVFIETVDINVDSLEEEVNTDFDMLNLLMGE